MGDLAILVVLAATILLASIVSVELGLSVALIELFAGFVVGNALDLDVPGWLSFIGSFAGVLLTFLAGAEVDVPQLRREWRASLSVGIVSFGAPFVVVGLLAYYGLGWDQRQAEIAGIHGALQGTGAATRGRVLLPDAVLLPERRDERLRGRVVGEPRRARAALRGEDGAEAGRCLPFRPALHCSARGVHHPVDVDRPDLRNDQRVVRPDRVYRPEAADELTKDAVEMAEAY
jgi:hypothetical protein